MPTTKDLPATFSSGDVFRLEQMAAQLGVTVEQATQIALDAELGRRTRISAPPAVVLPFRVKLEEGLKRGLVTE